MKEKLGVNIEFSGTLSPALMKAIDEVRGALNKIDLQKISQWLDNIPNYVDKAKNALEVVTDVIGKAESTINSVIDSVKNKGKELFDKVISQVQEKIFNIKGAFIELGVSVKDKVLTVIGDMKEKLLNVKDTAVQFGLSIKDKVLTVVGAMKDKLLYAKDTILQFGLTLKEKLGNVILGIKDKILTAKDTFMQFGLALKDKFGAIVLNVKDKILGMKNTVTQFISTSVEGFKNFLPDVVTKIKNKGAEIVSSFKDMLPDFKGTFNQLTSSVTAKVNDLAPKISSFFSKIPTSKEELGQTLLNVGKNLLGPEFLESFEGIKGTLTNVIDFVKDIFTKDWSTVWENIRGIVGNVFEDIKTSVMVPVNMIIGTVKELMSNINNIKDSALGFLEGIMQEILSIPFISDIINGGFDQFTIDWKGYLSKAAEMLGIDETLNSLGQKVASVFKIEGLENKPTIIIEGNADKKDIVEALEESYKEFMDLIERLFKGKKEETYVAES